MTRKRTSSVRESDMIKTGLSSFQRNGGTGNQEEVCDRQHHRIHQHGRRSNSHLEVGLPLKQWSEICEQRHYLPSPEQDERCTKESWRSSWCKNPGKGCSERKGGMERNALGPMTWKDAVYFVSYSCFTSDFDFEVLRFCTGLDVRWRLLCLWSKHPTFDDLWFTSRVRGREYLERSFLWILLLQNHKTVPVNGKRL